MNSLMEQQSELLESTMELRRDLLSVLTDADLAFRLPGRNGTLGELCRESGEIEQAYINGFKHFKQDFDYRHPDPAVTTQVDKLRAWLESLDKDLVETLKALDEADLQKPVDRGYGFAPSVTMNFHIYREALLIFYAKANVYLKALDKRVPGKWAWWIGDFADFPTP